MIRAVSGLEQRVGNGLSKVANSKFMKNQFAKNLKNPEAFAVTMLVTSLVSKDAVNCYYYVTQSLHNEKIPEDKRKFVAALDLMNGIMNVVGQILITKFLEKKITNSVFKNKIGNKLDEDTLMMHAKKIVKESDKKLDVKEVQKALVKKYGEAAARTKSLQTGAGLLVGFLLTAAFAKRVLTPLIATPLAGWFKDKYMQDAPKETGKENLNDKLLSHETTPWNKTASTVEKPVLNKVN